MTPELRKQIVKLMRRDVKRTQESIKDFAEGDDSAVSMMSVPGGNFGWLECYPEDYGLANNLDMSSYKAGNICN